MYHLGLEQVSKKKSLKLLAYATEMNARALRAGPPALTYMVFYVFKPLRVDAKRYCLIPIRCVPEG